MSTPRFASSLKKSSNKQDVRSMTKRPRLLNYNGEDTPFSETTITGAISIELTIVPKTDKITIRTELERHPQIDSTVTEDFEGAETTSTRIDGKSTMSTRRKNSRKTCRRRRVKLRSQKKSSSPRRRLLTI